MAVPRILFRVLPMAALAIALPRPAQAQAAESDSAAVVRVSETLLRAISTRDTALARPLLLPGGVFVSVGSGRDGSARPARVQTHAEFLASLPQGKERFLERMWAPKVRLEGPLAEVRAPYDFHINGAFSHCGVDVFTLVKTPAGWLLAGTAYTAVTAGCAPSPLGPPK